LLVDSAGNHYELSNNGLNQSYFSGYFYFGCDWVSSDFDEVNQIVPQSSDRLSYKSYYKQKQLIAPRIARLNLVGDLWKKELLLDSFYYRVDSSVWLCGELSRFGVDEHRLMFFSVFSPTVSIYETPDMRLIDRIDVASGLTKTFIDPPVLDEAEAMDNKRQNKRLRTKGYIFSASTLDQERFLLWRKWRLMKPRHLVQMGICIDRMWF
jgi:hypothetical protein